jgi:hypothetical protein
MSEQIEDEGVPIQQQPKWPIEDGLEPLYANQFSILKTPYEVVLVFGEFNPTGFSGRSTEEIQEYLGKAEVTPVCKVIMSQAGAKALLAIMTDSLKEFSNE